MSDRAKGTVAFVIILFVCTIILLTASSAKPGKGQSGMLIRVGPVTTMDRVGFRLSDMSESEAMTAIIRLRVDKSEISEPYSVLVPPRTCQKQGSNWLCEAYIPAAIVTKLNVPGKHELYSYVFDGVGESEPSRSWTVTGPK